MNNIGTYRCILPNADQYHPRYFYFISDLHLNPGIPHTVAAFEHFVMAIVKDTSIVYILGDLFEYWLGDDMLVNPFSQHIVALLRTFAERKITLYLMHGNRDFLLGQRFAAAAQAQLISDPHVLHAFGQRIVLTHGDTLCTADHAYQRLRRIVRCRAMQRFFMMWPLRWRLALALRIQAKSRQRQALSQSQTLTNQYKAIKDVVPAAIAQLFTATGANLMIHGHTHQPAKHLHDNVIRWVLPDWDFDHGPARGGYLRLDEKGIHVLSIIDNKK